jgi:Mu-like prophage tail sheath protein gpL
MSYIKRENVVVQDLPILFNQDGAQYPRSVVVDAGDIAAAADGSKIVPAGSFVTLTGSTARFLARSTVTAAFTTGAATGTVASPFNTFKVGDALYIVEPYGTVTLGGTYLSTEIVKVTIGGYVLNTVTGSTTNATIATTVAAAINADPNISALVKAIASGAVIYLYGKDDVTAHTTTTAARNAADDGASASGTSTANASTLTISNTALGTILSVSTAGVITLGANAAVAAPVGARVGVRFGSLIGVYTHSIDFIAKPSVDIAPCLGCDTGIYTVNLPYVDEDIKRRLNRFVFY